MADTTYKRLDSDQLVFLVQYLFTKLKGSSLANNTTYTLEKSGTGVVLKDNKGTAVSSLTDVGVTYSDVTSEASGLMTPTMLETLNNLKSFSEGGIATIKVNGTALTITNNTVDITIPTKTSDLTNDSGFLTSHQDISGKANTADLATVATSGSYNDLTNKPTISNATLTIQKNGTSVGTFTANATSNKSINITVPTAVSSLTNDSKYQTESQVTSKIEGYGYQTAAQVTSAINAASHLTKSVVTALPAVASAEENVIYLMKSTTATATNNIYDEYLLINGAFEKIGDTNLDLSGYVQNTQMVTLTNSEITTIVDNAYTEVFK